MKIKLITFYGWVVLLFISTYVSFKTPVEYHFFTLFGYKIGFGAFSSNMPIKIAFLILLGSTIIQSLKIKKQEREYIIDDNIKYVKKKKNKVSVFKSLIKI